MEIWLIVLLSVLGAILLLSVLLVVVVEFYYQTSFVRHEEKEELDPVSQKAMSNIDFSAIAEDKKRVQEQLNVMPHEEWTIVDAQHQKLKGYAYKQNDSKEWFLVSHGYRGNGQSDLALVFPFLLKDGKNFLAVDHQASGNSEGNKILFGLEEHKALILWMNQLIQEEGEDISIYLLGVSMGCGSALYTSDKDVPKQLKCIVADCGFISPIHVFEYLCHEYLHLPKWPLLPMMRLIVKRKDHVDIASTTTDCVRHARVPILYFCGDEDKFVPLPNTIELYNATSTMKELVVVKGAAHAMSYRTNPELYTQKLYNFLDKVNSSRE